MAHSPPAPAAWPLPRWIAHRGAGLQAPENTLAAFREGARHGYRAFECDVKLSADDELLLLHDATLERTSNGQGRAADQPWAALSRLDAGSWHGQAFAGEPLARLAAVATWLVRNDFRLDLEIKPTPGDEARCGRLVAAAAQRLWAGHPPPVLSSFQPVALQAAQAAAPELPRALLLDSLWAGWWDMTQSLECVAVITHHRLMDGAMVQRLQGAGLKALVYTVNEREEAQRLLALGVDGIITDAVHQLPGDLGA